MEMIVKNLNFSKSETPKAFDEETIQNNKIEETKPISKSENAMQIVMIKNENLFDCKYNTEDIEDTLDLENSIKELGFIDVIEVTDFFDIGEGNYTIISGHRRRRAGVKVNIDKFKNILKSDLTFSDKDSALMCIEKIRSLMEALSLEIEKISKEFEIEN